MYDGSFNQVGEIFNSTKLTEFNGFLGLIDVIGIKLSLEVAFLIVSTMNSDDGSTPRKKP